MGEDEFTLDKFKQGNQCVYRLKVLVAIHVFEKQANLFGNEMKAVLLT